MQGSTEYSAEQQQPIWFCQLADSIGTVGETCLVGIAAYLNKLNRMQTSRDHGNKISEH